jgi:IS5 family transposase
MRFLDLTLADDVPDSRTVWNFREQITDIGLAEKLFELFLKELNTLGLVINENKIIDASFVEVLRQHNRSAENEQIKEEGKSKLIVKYSVTSAEVHDSLATDILLDEKNKGEPQEQIIAKREMKNRVCEKGYRNRPLTEEQKANNTEKSRFRSRVEHIFEFMEMLMNEMYNQRT